MQNKIINCELISQKIKDELKEKVNKFKKKPTLAVILVGNDKASEIYVKNKEKACEYIGINSKKYILEENIQEGDLLDLINQLNDDNDVNGILVQLPLPEHIDKDKVITTISKDKDVDCFHPYNIGLIGSNNNTYLPCTPSGCVEILKKSNINIQGKHCVILGRSDIVGKPLAMMMLKENATVTICHSKTENLEAITKQADILISAIGVPKFVKANMIKEGVIILDVGINRTKNGICGDVDFDDCIAKVSKITTVPKGVGLLTVSMLLKNVIDNVKTTSFC